MNHKDMALRMAQASLDKKAKDIVLMDLRGLSSLCDYQIVCSGDSDRQVSAIALHIEEICREEFNLKPTVTEGKSTGNWVLLDFSGIMVHVFLDDLRRYYAIESLWPTAPVEAIS
ncbi:MAG: ribosome silencing factor [Pseudomonadota bacterium]